MHILLAAAPGLVRDGIVRVVSELGASVDVRCIDDLKATSPHGVPQLVVLDGDLDTEPAHAVQAVHAQMSSVRVVVLLSSAAPPVIEKLLDAGIAGCVEKSAPAGVFLGALRLALAGGTYLPPSMIAGGGSWSKPPPAATPFAAATNEDSAPNLTPRQVEVLALVALGAPNKTIARQLSISEGTVKIHLTAVYKALKVKSRTQATSVAMRRQEVVDEQVRHAFGGSTALGRLIPHMTLRKVKARGVLFKKGDPTDALYYILQGVLHLDEIDIDVGSGTLLGEVGLFTPERKRTLTARTKTDVEVLWIAASDALRICYQDPEIALYLMRLITRRLLDSTER